LYNAIASLMEHSPSYRAQQNAVDIDNFLTRPVQIQSRENVPASVNTDRSYTPGDEYEDSEDNGHELNVSEGFPERTMSWHEQGMDNCQEDRGPALAHTVHDLQKQVSAFVLATYRQISERLLIGEEFGATIANHETCNIFTDGAPIRHRIKTFHPQ
jgi:hypothetical protein